jgi:hypothetical protein
VSDHGRLFFCRKNQRRREGITTDTQRAALYPTDDVEFQAFSEKKSRRSAAGLAAYNDALRVRRIYRALISENL